jgi:hypothetical protein
MRNSKNGQMVCPDNEQKKGRNVMAKNKKAKEVKETAEIQSTFFMEEKIAVSTGTGDGKKESVVIAYVFPNAEAVQDYMKFSVYLTVPVDIPPAGIMWAEPIAWSAQGKPTHFTSKKPAFISKHKVIGGFTYCIRASTLRLQKQKPPT